MRFNQVGPGQSTSLFFFGEVRSEMRSVRDGFGSVRTRRRRSSPLTWRHTRAMPLGPLRSAMGYSQPWRSFAKWQEALTGSASMFPEMAGRRVYYATDALALRRLMP